ncbi:MAG: GNAT family N-acetyltransferase [Polyangiales bacterium]
MHDLLDNVVWHSLTGAQAHCASGSGGARRYARGFSPIVGFADQHTPDFAALRPHCQPDEHFYSDGWAGAPPSGVQIDEESTMFKLVWAAPLPAAKALAPAVRLRAEHAPQALALAQLTRPGPFGIRTIELGEYFGYFDGPRLIAMAGERMQAGRYREISGVCTHPDFQGRGLARELMLKLLRRQLQRDQTPFLHVMRDNVTARAMYLRMGFEIYRESVVRVLSCEP